MSMQADPGHEGHEQAEKLHWTENLEAIWDRLRTSLAFQSMLRLKWHWLAVLILYVIVIVLTNMSLSATARVIDDGIIYRTEPVGPMLRELVILFTGILVFGYAARMVGSWIGVRIEYDLRTWLYRGLHSLDPRRLNSVASGQMVTRAMTDLRLLIVFIVFIPAYSVTVTLLLGRFIWLFMQNVPMTIVVTLGIPFNLWLVMRMRRRMWGFSWISLNRRAEVTTTFDEAVRGIRVVKAFAREPEERDRLRGTAERTFGAVMARIRVLAKFDFVMKLAPMVVNVIIVFMAARIAGVGGITVGVLIVYVEAAQRFANFAARLDNIVNLWMWSKTGAGRIYELVGLLDRSARHETPRTGGPAPEASTGLEARDLGVFFDGYPALQNVSFRAGYGELLAVAGPPRAGRSTLAQVLAGDLEPSEGEVLLDGADIMTIHPGEMRRVVVVVPEESFLFNRTLRENLLLGARGEQVSDDELLEAVRAAGAEEVVAGMPAGLDTVLAEAGMNLSGGERQRLALARALVRPPRVLVLDDALTAVNPSLEIDILQRVRERASESAIVCLTRRDAARVVADGVVTLPAPAPNAPPGPEPLELGPYGQFRDMPYDARLDTIIRHELPPATDRPDVPEGECNWSQEPPGLLNTLAPLKQRVIIAGLLLFAFTLASLGPAFTFGQAIDAIQARDMMTSDLWALALGGISLVFAGVAFVLRIYRTRVEESIVYLLRRRVMHRITRLGIDYYDRDGAGYMATRVVNDIDQIGRFVDQAVFRALNSSVMFLSVVVVLFIWSPPIAMVLLVATPLLVALTLAFFPLIARAFVRVRTDLGEVVQRLQEDFVGRAELQTFRMRARSYEAFVPMAWKLLMSRFKAAALTNGYAQVAEFFMNVALVGVLWVAGEQFLAGAITIGALATFRLYTDQVLEPLPELANVVEDYLETRASVQRLREPFTAPIYPPEGPGSAGGNYPDQPSGPGGKSGIEGEIIFEDVDFVYPGTERVVLEGVSLEIAPGETVAFVGATGAGKSSVVKLAARMYDPSSGRILVDGTDLREYEHIWYHQRIGYVPQEAFCFRGTVRENLVYGRRQATDDEVTEAMRQVGAYEALIAIPGGLDGLVEQEGKNLTAAQRALISLTRTWLVDPDVLMLDEATGLLDADMEEQVVRNIHELGRTTLLITHRLHVAREADRIVVVDEGVVVEEGSHRELMRAGGVYSRLWAYGPEVSDESMARTGSRSRARAKKSAAKSSGAQAKGRAQTKGRSPAKAK